MTKILSFALASALTLSALPVAAQGYGEGPKWNYWNWPRGHFERPFDRPYLHQPKVYYAPFYSAEDWDVETWASLRDNGAEELIQDWYVSDIIADQYLDRPWIFSKYRSEGGTPVLAVGRNFYFLSETDKRKVLKVIDYHHGYTKAHPEGSLRLVDGLTRKRIGLYTVDGLSLE